MKYPYTRTYQVCDKRGEGSSPFPLKWRGTGPCKNRGKMVKNQVKRMKNDYFTPVFCKNRLLSISKEMDRSQVLWDNDLLLNLSEMNRNYFMVKIYFIASNGVNYFKILLNN